MDFRALYNAADAAGKKAAKEIVPVPMYVGTAKNLFGNDIDTSQPVYKVDDGVCGFAWVNLKPGNSKFANWLKANGYARRDEYYGGVTIWVSDYNQSMTRKQAYAGAFARTLNDAGFKRAYSMSRMD